MDVFLPTPFPGSVLSPELCSTCILLSLMVLGDSLLLWREKTVSGRVHSIPRLRQFMVWTVTRSASILASRHYPTKESSETRVCRRIGAIRYSGVAGGELPFARTEGTHCCYPFPSEQARRYWLRGALPSLHLFSRMMGSSLPFCSSSALRRTHRSA